MWSPVPMRDEQHVDATERVEILADAEGGLAEPEYLRLAGLGVCGR
jgi:hypothetical protein